MALELSSPAFGADETIPKKYTCEGDDTSPPLAWSGAPEGTRSFVLLCDDPDAPAGTWHHWAVYDIPAERTELAEGLAKAPEADGLRQAVSDFRKPGYGGPCPPPGHGPHHYHFKLLALDTDSLGLGEGAHCTEVERATEGHVLERTELVGLYER